MKRWWEHPEGDAHETVVGLVRELRQQQHGRTNKIREDLELYGAAAQTIISGNSEPLSVNVIYSVGAALEARVTKQRPRAMFTPIAQTMLDECFSAQHRAGLRTRFVDGLWYETGLRRMAPLVWRDAMVTGAGVLKVCVERGRVVHERVPAEEVIVDEEDARYGTPSQMFEWRLVDRSRLASLYPDQRDAIMACPGARREGLADVAWRTTALDARAVDLIALCGAWRLPFGEDDPGRVIACTENATLVDDDWTDERFPFAVMQFEAPQRGFWGRSLVDVLLGFQLEITDLLRTIRVNHRLHGNPRMLLERGSKILPSKITDDFGDVIEYTGTQPVLSSPQIISPEIYNHVWTIHQKAANEVGASELFVTGKKPSGLDSAVAQREYTDITSERHLPIGRAYEDWHVHDVADLDMRAATRAAKANPKLFVKSLGRDYGATTAEIVKWSDVSRPGEEYVVQAFPTSSMPQSPPAKRQWLSELVQDGVISVDDYAAELEIPMVDRAIRLRGAARRSIERIIERIVTERRYSPPESYHPLDECLRVGRSYYMLAQSSLPPEDEDADSAEVLDLLRRWIDDAEALARDAVQAQQAQAAPPGAPPAPPAPGAA